MVLLEISFYQDLYWEIHWASPSLYFLDSGTVFHLLPKKKIYFKKQEEVRQGWKKWAKFGYHLEHLTIIWQCLAIIWQTFGICYVAKWVSNFAKSLLSICQITIVWHIWSHLAIFDNHLATWHILPKTLLNTNVWSCDKLIKHNQLWLGEGGESSHTGKEATVESFTVYQHIGSYASNPSCCAAEIKKFLLFSNCCHSLPIVKNQSSTHWKRLTISSNCVKEKESGRTSEEGKVRTSWGRGMGRGWGEGGGKEKRGTYKSKT